MANDTALTELLDALRHDLGKYLTLPLRLLPRDAADAELRRAVGDALLRTQRSQHETRSATDIYAAARTELAARSPDRSKLATLDQAVQRATAWQAALDAAAPLDRAAIERDFACVRELLDAWLDEVAHD